MRPFTLKHVIRSVLVATTAALALAPLAAVRPAYAAGTPNIGVATQYNGSGYSVGMAQVLIQGCNFHNNVPVWFGVHDTTSTDPNAWYGGWVTTGGPSNPFRFIRWATVGPAQLCDGGWDASDPNFEVMVNVPATSCNHPMRADATDSDGTGVRTVNFNLNCFSSPQIQVTQTMDLSTGMIGSGQARLTGWGAVPSQKQRIWVGIHDTSRASEQGHYYGGWVDSDGSGAFAVTTTNIPSSDCGDQFDAYVVDNASTVAATSNHVAFKLYCGPQLYPTGNGGFAGRYFTPGQPVTVTFTNAANQQVAPAQFPTASLPQLNPITRAMVGGGTISGKLPTICGVTQVVAYQAGQPATLPMLWNFAC